MCRVAPSPPVLTKRGSKELSLEWKPLKGSGIYVGKNSNEGLLRYVLEGAEGEQFHRGVPPATLQPGPSADFKVIAHGTDLVSTTVEDLAASTWYYWRVVYEYAGSRFESPPVAINTSAGVPLNPDVPMIETEKFPGPMLEKRVSVEYKVKLSWPEGRYVGATIEKYMLQLHEVYMTLNEFEMESMAPGVNSPKSKMYRQYHKIAIDENIGSTLRSKNIESSRWKTVYCDIGTQFSIKAPPLGTLQWNFRLRAMNCHGWSDDWVYFYINHRSHPIIFPAGKEIDRRLYADIAPAEKEPTPTLQTQPSISHAVPSSAPTHPSPPLVGEEGSKSFARTAAGVNYELELSRPEQDSLVSDISMERTGANSDKRREPFAPPPKGLRTGQLSLDHPSADSSSVWLDEKSLDMQSLSVESEYTRGDRLKKLTDSEVTRWNLAFIHIKFLTQYIWCM